MLAFSAHCVREFWPVVEIRKKGKNGEGKRRGGLVVREERGRIEMRDLKGTERRSWP